MKTMSIAAAALSMALAGSALAQEKVAIGMSGWTGFGPLSLAKEAGLYIHQDPALLERLGSLQEGESVPPALYVVIAEILAYSYLLQGKFPEHWQRQDGSRAIDTKI